MSYLNFHCLPWNMPSFRIILQKKFWNMLFVSTWKITLLFDCCKWSHCSYYISLSLILFGNLYQLILNIHCDKPRYREAPLLKIDLYDPNIFLLSRMFLYVWISLFLSNFSSFLSLSLSYVLIYAYLYLYIYFSLSLLHRKIQSSQALAIFMKILGCSNLGSMFQVR